MAQGPLPGTVRRRLSRRSVLSQVPALSIASGLAVRSGTRAFAQETNITLPKGKPTILIDTDAANYFDDQFALAYALLSPDSVQVDALYSAPFANRRVTDPGDGARQSLEEIGRVLNALGLDGTVPVFPGASEWLSDPNTPVRSPASDDLIERVFAADPPIDFVVAIGAATNVASALILEPRLSAKTTFVWLGGTPHHFPSASEFNLRQDSEAARVLFDSGARLVHVPAPGLAENLRTTREELGRRMRGTSEIGDYLLHLVEAAVPADKERQRSSRTLAIWDMAPVAWLVNPSWVETALVPSPSLSNRLTWTSRPEQHRVRTAIRLLRDEVFTDFFRKIESAPA